MIAEEGLFEFKKVKSRQSKKPKGGKKQSKKAKGSIAEGEDFGNLGNVNPKGKINKRKRNKFPTKPQISDGNKKYDLKQLEDKIAKLNEVPEPNKKIRKKLRQLEHLQKKITQIILTRQTLAGEEAAAAERHFAADKTIDSDDDTKDITEEINDDVSDADEDNEMGEDEKDSDELMNGSEDEEKATNGKAKKANKSKKVNNDDDEGESSDDASDGDDKLKRFVVFVGNLGKEVTEADIRTHFAKVGKIKSVRIPEKKETRKSGFAFVELEDQLMYEKTLSMHHTMMMNRRINVMYTRPDKNFDKKEIQKKNAKIDAMRKSGQLAGSVPEHQRRSFRRKKKRLAEAKAAEDAERR